MQDLLKKSRKKEIESGLSGRLNVSDRNKRRNDHGSNKNKGESPS